ncbi:peroxiredoxin [Sphingomonas sp. GB1N7]|uniref:peroxiredoxin n=1 Tax=Parasphingomonas caseinilytica TaxID=3096158 RepID=UPI002FC855D5
MSVELGDTLPDVALTRPDGTKIDLRASIGTPLVLYFYPKDDTTGCTREAQDFGALYPDFQAIGVEVLGVSKDTPAKHAKFITKYDLKVPLASDEDGSVTEAFGVWIEKQLYGKTYMGIDRSTWLFDAAGTLQKVWRKVKVPGHAAAVMEAAKALG